jgi:hypothetical protein
MMDRLRVVACAIVASLSSCRCDNDDKQYITVTGDDISSSDDAAHLGTTEDTGSEPIPGTTTTFTTGDDASTSSGTESGDAGSSCNGEMCSADTFCVAPYANAVRGPFACVDACVGPMDEDHWCFDASACCDPTATCTIRGYCIAPGGGSSSDDGGTTAGSGTEG